MPPPTGNTAFNATAYNDQSNINASRGISDFNRPHRLAVSYAYDLPFFVHATGFKRGALGGWQVSGVAILQTGIPFLHLMTPVQVNEPLFWGKEVIAAAGRKPRARGGDRKRIIKTVILLAGGWPTDI